ncbi:methylenetetrahydrofolate reductase [Desulfofustis glycolicus]|uniref:Methylenetetrahydrofolate reductase n=1 Tax=Desulfofustis glycolicus DSM 9705 TaxID=1121409 RepID=A0A1M5TPR6_9BACT|nr:methylenetetrahydrofolate reductase [Desulfofustis glycolicus]MCB2216528.1 methylenetetrahydrofolate reductase [Desulfobulbaceae bacterium]SHH52681.1 5,10-methylenetetrahydrofolate reductase [Desulfofustis glycolicus DSM 9705]
MEAAAASRSPRPSRLIIELDPPKGTNLQTFLDAALAIRGRVNGIRVTDNEHAIMRMAPLAPCLALRDKGIEPAMVINGRDRNRLSFQADLLCAAALGVKDIVIKQGHDAREGDQPLARTSGDLDLDTMLACVARLNGGKDLSGEDLDGATDFTIGVYLELSDDVNRNRQLADYLLKLKDFGVQSVTLSPTYDLNIIELFLPAAEQTGIRLYPSLLLLKSVTMIRYLNNLAGVPSIPQEFQKKMMQAADKKSAGLQVAADFLRELQPLGEAVVLVSLGWKDRLPEFLNLIER